MCSSYIESLYDKEIPFILSYQNSYLEYFISRNCFFNEKLPCSVFTQMEYHIMKCNVSYMSSYIDAFIISIHGWDYSHPSTGKKEK